MSIVLLLAWLLVVYFFIAFLRHWLRLWFVVAVVGYIALVNAGSFERTFPALASYYEKPSGWFQGIGDTHRLLPPDYFTPSRPSTAGWRDPVHSATT